MIEMQIFELFGSIDLKDSGVASKLDAIDKKGSSTSKSMGLSFGSMASAALKLGAAIGIGLGFKDMITNTISAQKNLAQMDAVLKSTGGAAGMTKDQLLALADSQGKLTTFSKGANMETENLLLTFTSIGKTVFPDALKVVNDMSTALGQDTKSSAIQLGKALNDPINGMTALKRVGVQFTDSQKEQIKTLQKSGDIMGAQKVILQELQKEFGGSAIAAGQTFGGVLTILKNQMTGVGVSIGTMLLPYMNTFIKTITDNMPKIKDTINAAISFIVPLFQKWMILIGEIASELFPSMGTATDSVKNKVGLFSGALNIVTGILTFVRDNLTFVRIALEALGIIWLLNTGYVFAYNAVLTYHNIIAAVTAIRLKAVAAAQWLTNAAMTANPIGLVVAALIVLGGTIYEVVKHFDQITAAIKGAWNALNLWNITPAQSKQANVTMTQNGLGVTSKAGGYASGTDYATAGMHWVGENGPEIVNFKGGETVKNAKDSAKVSAGLTLTIGTFVNNRKEDMEELAQELQFYMKQKSLGGSR